MHEIETRLIDGQLLRVYKNLWPSLRVFWLWAAAEHKDVIYAVFEKQRYTFAQVFERSLKAASIFYHVYGVRKGQSLILPLTSQDLPPQSFIRRQGGYLLEKLS